MIESIFILMFSLFIIVIFMAIYNTYRKNKKNNKIKNYIFTKITGGKKLEELKENHLKEIKKLIKETRQLDKAKEKIQKWKKEGYDVSELEKLLEEVK